MRVIASRAAIAEQERHAALLLAFDRATTGFGWSRPGRSAVAGNTLYTVLPGETSPRLAPGSPRCGPRCRPHLTLMAGISAPAASDICPRHARKPTNAWHSTKPGLEAASRLPTRSRGTTSCSNASAPPHDQDAHRPGGR